MTELLLQMFQVDLLNTALLIYTEYPTHNKGEQMSDTPTKVIVDCSTGITEVVPLTAEEIADLETARQQAELDRAEKEAQEAAQAKTKADVLKRLGITESEAKALLS